MTNATKAEIRQQWEARIAEFRNSGLSGTAWCAANGIIPNQLWYWLKKIRSQENPQTTSTKWLPVELNELGPSGQGNGLLIKIGLAAIEVQPGFNPALLQDVIRTLAATC
ncbi:IS66 family insertion sequence element accessory protein TnpA [Desulfotruncus alcoholivorax]|uniref:IS66 family insertion sequence element accessory protein TnpA n=1 Tax=Desulfotruncus alcoholivorax TaxID=265477 RepID=UPI0003F8090D|nr:hypothetical protein [Desulfotruncus alcoholivorax]